MFLLDTNVVSELRKAANGKADQNVVTWASAVSPATLYLSVISVLEIEMGILKRARHDAPQAAVLRAWLEQFVLPAFDGRTLPVDVPVALKAASLNVPNPHGSSDCLIAATALVHGLTVVTRNVADFEGTGLKLLNPWAA